MKTFNDAIREIRNKSEEERINIDALLKEMRLVDKIARERNKRGMTQKELADKVGMTVDEIERFECQRSSPKIDTLLKIADALKLTIKIEH